jgi:hypothetical protein
VFCILYNKRTEHRYLFLNNVECRWLLEARKNRIYLDNVILECSSSSESNTEIDILESILSFHRAPVGGVDSERVPPSNEAWSGQRETTHASLNLGRNLEISYYET